MIISPKLKVVFVHNPKCAGMSIEKAMKEIDKNTFMLGTRHNNLTDLTPEYEDYVKFTIVRNPWDRMVSLYHQFWKVRDKYTPKIVPEIEDRTFKYWVTKAHELESFAADSEMTTTNRYPQFYWADDCDMVFHFEDGLSKMMGLLFDREPWHLGIENKSNKSDYVKYYDDELKEYVKSLFQVDINYYDYTFEGVGYDRSDR